METSKRFICKVFKPFDVSAVDSFQIFLGQRTPSGQLAEITATLHIKYPTEPSIGEPLKPFINNADPEMLQAFSQALYDAGFKPNGLEIIETEKTLLREIIDIKKDEVTFIRSLIKDED